MASLMLFTGKGGVGKSTVSAATAQHWASQGYRTILVSSDPAHSTDDTLGVSVGLQTTKIADNFWARNIDAEREAKIFADSLNAASKETFEKLLQIYNCNQEKFDIAAKDNMPDMNNYSKILYENFKTIL